MTVAHPTDWNAVAARAVIDTLRENGVQSVVVSPGSRSTPLVLAAAQRLRTTVIVDERVAGFYALGVARREGACALICTSGTAAAHYYPAVIEASLTRTPLVLLTADRPPELRDCGAPQTVRQDGLFGRHVRYSVTLPTPANIRDARACATATVRALSAALGGPRGPVHLNAPYRKPLWIDHAEPSHLTSVPSIQPTPPGMSELGIVQDRLEAASRPVLWVGPHAPEGAFDAARSLGRSLNIPVLSEMSPVDHDVAHLDLILRSKAARRALEPDLVLHVGQPPIGKGVIQWMAELDAPRIAFDPDGWPQAPDHQLDHLWSGDVTAALGALERSGTRRPPEWVRVWSHLSAVAAAVLETPSAVFDERTVARSVSARGGHLHVASSMPVRDVAAFGRPERVTYSRGANGIDGTVATALGIGADTVLLGDLALRHDLSGLMAAVELRATLDVVCVDNAGGGIFQMLPIAAHAQAFERYFVTPQRVELSSVAAGTGAEVVVVESSDALREALESPADGVRVVIARVDRDTSFQARQQITAEVLSALEREVL